MKKINKKIINIFFVLVFIALNAQLAIADGGLVPPPGKIIKETDQKAVIFYDKGLEQLILSITFQGDTDNFAWIVPVPSKPTIEKSVDSLFVKLDKMTKPPEPETSLYHADKLGAATESNEQGVTVIETKKVEYYDITVLEATDKNALHEWLNENGYVFPQGGESIADSYIQKGWYFTAIKLNNEASEENPFTEEQLRTGRAIPLKLSFKTDRIVYPLKISSLSGLENTTPAGEVAYVEGIEGKAIKLNSEKIIATDKVIDNFNFSDGNLNLFLKKDSPEAIGEILTIEKGNSSSINKKESVEMINIIKNNFAFNIRTQSPSGKLYGYSCSLDLGSDFRENEWQQYEFQWKVNLATGKIETALKIDGQTRTLDATRLSEGPIKLDSLTNEKTQVTIGGQMEQPIVMEMDQPSIMENTTDKNETSIEDPVENLMPRYSTFRNIDLLIDSLKINSGGKEILQANFENDLKIKLADEKENIFRIFENNNYPIARRSWPVSTGILIYIFADNKYEIPGFNIQYADWITKEDIKNITTIEGTELWIKPIKRKYFLTRLYRNMTAAEMNEDLYPAKSKTPKSSNTLITSQRITGGLYIIIGLSLFSIGLIIGLIIKSNKGPGSSKDQDNKNNLN